MILNKWETYETGSAEVRCSMTRWGKDHWSTFAYIETRTVDYKGILNNRHMRANPRLHREFAHIQDGKDYPTIIKGGDVIENHDDWSCLEDMVANDLVRVWVKQVETRVFNNSLARVELTETGRWVANQLREHKAAGGMYATFELGG